MSVQFALVLHGLTLVAVFTYLRLRVERMLSFTGISLGLLALIHGLPVSVYLLWTGPDTFIFDAALERVDRDATMAQLPLALTLMFMMFLTGTEVARALLAGWTRRGRRAARLQGPGPLGRRIRLQKLARAALWALVASMISVSILENQLTKTIEYFASGESELGKILLRVESGGTPYYLYNLLLSSVAPFLVMVSYCASRNQPRKYGLQVLSALLFLAVLLGKFGTLSKAPPVIFLLQLLLLALLVRRQRLNIRTVALVVGVSASLFVGIVSSTIPDLDILAAFSFLYYRMFDIPNEVLLEYFAAVPATLPFGGGGGMLAILREAPADRYVPMMAAVAEVTRDSLISTSNAMFIGDAWAEFGWVGIAVFSMVAGILMQSIDGYTFRNGETDESACLVAGGAYGIFTMLSTSLTTAMLTGGLLLLPVLANLLVKGARRRGDKPSAPLRAMAT